MRMKYRASHRLDRYVESAVLKAGRNFLRRSRSRSPLSGNSTLAIFTFLALTPLGAAPIEPGPLFTAELSTPPANHVLVAPGDSWRLFKGTTQPEASWEILDETSLSTAWKSKPGGFGYGYPNEGTVLSDMKNSYSTAYIRHTFVVDEVFDPQRLRLQLDYDDGFVAFLDGVEIARANAPGTPGQFPPFNSLATAAHSGVGSNRTVFPLESNAPALFVHEEDGPQIRHVLAIQGLNHSLSDDAFALNPTLLVEDFFPVTGQGTIQLSGRAAIPGIAAVNVNGAPAALDVAAARWTRSQNLSPGMNRLIIEARDSGNAVLASLTNDVVYKPSSTLISGGPLTLNTTWGPSMGVVEVNGPVQIPANITLTIAPGTTVMFAPGGSLRLHGGTLNVAGATNSPVFLLPLDGHTVWKGIASSEAGSSITLRSAEMVAGGINITNQVSLVIEDSILRDFSYDTYQWRFNGGNLAAGTNASLSISNFGSAQQGHYDVVVSDGHQSVTSAAATLVLDSPIRFALPQTSNGQLNFWMVGRRGAKLLLETSTNLFDWNPVLTNATPAGLTHYQDNLSAGLRFYRFQVMP